MNSLHVLLVVTGLAALGFILAGMQHPETLCTEKLCVCTREFSELPCNSCTFRGVVFDLGVLRVRAMCPAIEMLHCSSGEGGEREIAVNYGECTYRLEFG